MKLKRIAALFGLLALLGVIIFPAAAQDLPPLPGELVVGELDAPRGIAFDDAGNLIVTVVGSGGSAQATMITPEGEFETNMGLTGAILAVAPDGSVSTVAAGYPSYSTPAEVLGLYRAIPHGDSLWLVTTGLGKGTVGAFWTDSVVELDRATLATKNVINLSSIEFAQDPDGKGYDSNTTDIAWGPDGTLFITSSGGNDLLCWTPETGLQVVHVWDDNPVPSAIEIANNGDWYIGLMGTGLAPGAGRIEHWSNGELVETFGGLTFVSDILLDGENLYAVELMNFSDQGPGPGRVVKVTADGATPIAEGLITPFGLAKGPDGALYVSYGTIAFAPGMKGGVIKLPMGG